VVDVSCVVNRGLRLYRGVVWPSWSFLSMKYDTPPRVDSKKKDR
jgi:hypothetical protein